jgi:hypothetical protein
MVGLEDSAHPTQLRGWTIVIHQAILCQTASGSRYRNSASELDSNRYIALGNRNQDPSKEVPRVIHSTFKNYAIQKKTYPVSQVEGLLSAATGTFGRSIFTIRVCRDEHERYRSRLSASGHFGFQRRYGQYEYDRF